MKNKFLILRKMLTWNKWSYDFLNKTLVFFTCNYSDDENNMLTFGYKPKSWIYDVSFMDFIKLFLDKRLRTDFSLHTDYFYEVMTERQYIRKYGRP